MSKLSRDKGKRGERDFAAFCQLHGFDVHRTAQCCGKTGQAPDVIGIPGVHIEVKRTERLNLPAAFDQATRDAAAAGTGNIPVVAHRMSRQPWLVTMPADAWLRLLSSLKEAKS